MATLTLLLGSEMALAQQGLQCETASVNAWYLPVVKPFPDPDECQFLTGFRCEVPVPVGETEYRILNGCDPTSPSASCTVDVEVTYDLPGNSFNTAEVGNVIHWYNTSSAPPLSPGCDPQFSLDCDELVAECGYPVGQINENEVDSFVRLSGISCSSIGMQPVEYSTRAFVCVRLGCFDCEKIEGIAIDGPELAEGIGCPVPAQPPKDDSQGQCMVSPSSGGGENIRGGGPSLGAQSGPGSTGGQPGTTLHYRAGGVGGAGFPGSTEWRTTLGQYWSHDYAQRIVEDEDENHVWLLTEFGSFREFSGLSGGVYTTVSPSDEYRTLEFLGSGVGWELTDLLGTVMEFDGNGRWTKTTDRWGNETTATYNGSELQSVNFPDGRREDFTYVAGRLETITEISVSGATGESGPTPGRATT